MPFVVEKFTAKPLEAQYLWCTWRFFYALLDLHNRLKSRRYAVVLARPIIGVAVIDLSAQSPHQASP